MEDDVKRCCDCLRPEATKADWERYQEGEGEHLCWGSCDGVRPIDAHAVGYAEAIADVVAWLDRRTSRNATETVRLIKAGAAKGAAKRGGK